MEMFRFFKFLSKFQEFIIKFKMEIFRMTRFLVDFYIFMIGAFNLVFEFIFKYFSEYKCPNPEGQNWSVLKFNIHF